jgi:hypothetical protein
VTLALKNRSTVTIRSLFNNLQYPNRASSNMSSTNSFMNFKVTRIGDAPEHADLKQVCGRGKSAALGELLKPLSDKLPQPLIEASWMDESENYSDTFLVFFDKKSRNGLVITELANKEYQGVWALEGGDYPWADMPRLGLVFSQPNEQLVIDCLK